MIELTGTILYRDGRLEPATARQAEMAAWERHALRNGYPLIPPDDLANLKTPPLTMLRYLGYAAAHAGQPQGDWPAFDVWDAGVIDVTLEGVSEDEDGGAVVPPTRQGRSDEWSP